MPIRYTGRVHVKLRSAVSAVPIPFTTGTYILPNDRPLLPPALRPGGPMFSVASPSGSLALDKLARWHSFSLPPPMDAAPGGTDPDAVWDAIRAALRRPEVEFAEPDAVFELPIPPDVDAFVAPPGPTPTLGDVDPTWHLNAIHAPDAWEMFAAKGKLPGAGVRIAHLDTGVTDHPAVPLPPRLLNGYDF